MNILTLGKGKNASQTEQVLEKVRSVKIWCGVMKTDRVKKICKADTECD